MSIFKWGKEKREKEFLQQTQQMASKVLELIKEKTGKDFEDTTEMERQITAVFVFGMANGLAMDIKNTPLEVETGMIKILISIFKYSPKQASDFIKDMITSLQTKNKNDTKHAIIHRGLDGYYSYQNSKFEQLGDNIINIINRLSGSRY
ncbi:Imm48 family immunity protein [Clostridium beijerinckii]|uniref:Uncharacterized protein n=1 Tax=Clostridium beijerinckii TaxID=1520 RepID=A0A1S8S282_CLOBE|nr:Imm48 family immunity protein [Clostridium beijerinckii]NRY58935.1 hypothetical protein [Clostridium beijerinckii]OOM59580.1 hypothetical protein CLBCK_34110 [Clostridium beijerinckii]